MNCTKQKYNSERLACIMIDLIKHKKPNAFWETYYCKHCKSFHITSNPKWLKDTFKYK